jgi:2,3-bisphosphoglycerate-dependent phosphoglycerate mutase
VNRPDPRLTPFGHTQAHAVLNALAVLPVRLIASSGLQRALQTAEPTAQLFGLPVIVDDDLAYVPIGEITESDRRPHQWRA